MENELAFDFKPMRVRFELTQIEAAEILFVNQSQISRWERNGAMPPAYQQLWRNWVEKQRVMQK